MKKGNIRHIVALLMYCVGFVGFMVFLNFAKSISNEAMLYAIGAAFSAYMFGVGVCLGVR